jgi:glutamate-1-semialdehyde 2,1-aminomutase
LNNQFAQLCLPIEVTHTASIFWLHVSCARADSSHRTNSLLTNAAAFARIFHAALAGGVYLAPSGYEVNFMSLAHSDELLERAADTLVTAVATTTNN